MPRTHVIKPPPGRTPRFSQEEVENIRADLRSSATLADEYGVSYETIQRVRQRGRYRGLPYIARDHVAIAHHFPELLDDTPKDVVMARHIRDVTPRPDPFTMKPKRAGRKFLSGRGKLTLDEVVTIVADKRPTRTIAKEWGLQSNYVMQLKREHATMAAYTDKLDGCREQILADKRPAKVLAMVYKLPRWVIEKVQHDAGTAEETAR